MWRSRAKELLAFYDVTSDLLMKRRLIPLVLFGFRSEKTCLVPHCCRGLCSLFRYCVVLSFWATCLVPFLSHVLLTLNFAPVLLAKMRNWSQLSLVMLEGVFDISLF